MSLNNETRFIGIVGKDPDVKHNPNGSVVANFSIAVNDSWKDDKTGERKEKTYWFPVVAWGPLAKSVETLVKKGTKLLVGGKMIVEEWEDREGNKRTKTALHMAEFVLMNYKPQNQ